MRTRFCAHIFIVKNDVLESQTLQGPSIEEIKRAFAELLAKLTGKTAGSFRMRTQLLSKEMPFSMWTITAAGVSKTWVKVHKIEDSCPPGWRIV